MKEREIREGERECERGRQQARESEREREREREGRGVSVFKMERLSYVPLGSGKHAGLRARGVTAPPQAQRQRPRALPPRTWHSFWGLPTSELGAPFPKSRAVPGAIRGPQLHRVDLLLEHAKSNALAAKDLMEVTENGAGGSGGGA